MRTFSLLLVGLVPLLLLLVSTVRATVVTGSESIQQIVDILSQTEGEPLGKEQIVQLLKKLRAHSGHFDRNNIQPLIDASIIDRSKCNGPAIRSINEQLATRYQYALHLMPYLREAKNQLFELCRAELAHKMLEAVEDLNNKQVGELDGLLKKVRELVPQLQEQEAEMANIDVVREQLKEGLVRFIRRQFDSKSLNDGDLFLQRKFTDFAYCFSILRQFTGPLFAWEAFLDDADVVYPVDVNTMDWVLKLNLCKEVKDIKRKSYLELADTIGKDVVEKKGKKSWKRKWSNGIKLPLI